MSGDATTALLRMLRRSFAPNVTFTVVQIESRDWASATFAGTRHRIIFLLAGEGASAAADRFLDSLDEREFALRDHLVADIRLIARDQMAGDEGDRTRISLEVLTIVAD